VVDRLYVQEQSVPHDLRDTYKSAEIRSNYTKLQDLERFDVYKGRVIC
jgi:hypothetical protein